VYRVRLPDLAGKWFGTVAPRGTGILPVLQAIRHGRDAHATNNVPNHFPETTADSRSRSGNLTLPDNRTGVSPVFGQARCPPYFQMKGVKMMENDFLKHVPLFQHLSNEDLERLAGSFRERRLAKGEALFRKGAKGDALYIIKKGRIKISVSSHTGDEAVLAIFSASDFFGEMALLDGEPRSADAFALEPTELLLLGRPDFISFLSSA